VRARLTSSRFVGRVGELAELELAVREGVSGRPTLVLLGGDSGLGKTRLVAELQRRLTQPESDSVPLILRGDGVDQADGELPYAPLLGALRPLARARHPVLDTLSSATRRQLGRLVPGLDDNASPAGERTDATGQLRLFEAVLELIDALSEDAPLVLILEDMHWADRSTRAFVTFLARSLRTERVTLLLTYRTDELHRRHPLRPLLAELERLERARRVELEPFDRDELEQAVADILGSVPAGPLLTRLLERAEGNPLYTEELLAADLDGRGPPPRSLSDAFLQRIEPLSADAQRVARVLSLGRTLDEPALAAICDLDRERLSAALREAVGEQVLVVDPEDRFGFRHALLREALYDDLLPGERGSLHTELAHYLEKEAQIGAGDPEEEMLRRTSIAFHYSAAGDQTAALRTTVQAGIAARYAQAIGEAADLFQRALELWPRVPDAETVTGSDHVELLCRAAGAISILDERTRADSLLGQALDELDPSADPARYASILVRRGRVLWSLNRGKEAVAIGERALAMIPAGDAGGDRMLIRAWLARLQFVRGRFREAKADGEAALAEALAAEDRDAEIELRNTLGMAKVCLGEVEEGLGSLRRAITLARECDELDSLAVAYANLADMLAIAGRIVEAVGIAQEGLAATPRNHVRNRDWLSLTLSEVAFIAGDWSLARECLSPSAERAAGILSIFRQTREAELAAGIGDEQRALDCLDSVADLVAASSEPQWIGVFGSVSAEVHARRGDLEAAQAAVAQALDRMEVCTDDVARIARVSLTGLRVEADRAQRARDLGDAAMRRDALARARVHLSRIEAAAPDGGPLERARLAEGRAESARARGRATARDWARAADACEAIAHPYPAAVARWREAECHVAHGDRDAAATAVAAAVRGARELGSVWLEREARGLAERARLSPDGAAVRRRRRRRPRPRIRSGSPRASARCSPWLPRVPPTARSAPRCTWPRRRPVFTCRGSSRSSTCRGAPRPLRWPIACTSHSRRVGPVARQDGWRLAGYAVRARFLALGSERSSSWSSRSAPGVPSLSCRERSRSALISAPRRIATLVIQIQTRKAMIPPRVP
jgi:tetratricopeptide (TPR) repeat protein